MVRIRFPALFFALMASVSPVWADDAVTVRASAKDDYTRIVFDWPKAPSYVTDKTSNSLTLKFQGAAQFKVEQSPTGLPRVTSYATPDSKTAVIGFIGGQDVRHFEIGNRVIVDIRGPANAPIPKTEVKLEEIKAEAKKPETSAAEKAVAAIKTGDEPKVSAVPVAKVEKAPEIATDKALTIQLTSTEVMGLAVFKRFGNLWIVVDQPDYPVSPQISGNGAKGLGTFERVNLKEATAFRLALPDNRDFHVEGGGLVWKIVSDTIPASFPSTGFKKLAAADNRTNSVLWPVPSARRIIELNDPVVGDTLKVATVDAGKYYSGDVHSYTEFDSLRSFAGLAIESKVDDIDAKKTKDGIVIATPYGVSVSPDSDTAFLQAPLPKPAAQEKPEAEGETAPAPVTAPPEKASTLQLFKFADWKMGDQKAVDENRRIIMSGLKDKDEQTRAQDLIKLAKMELAYGRGPEAGGYLDMAEQFVPDLEDTPDFLGLKGAAEALSGNDERGLKDFSNPLLKDFPETPLWKAYTLAGLDDWKQAADTLPANFTPMSIYPDAVRIPIALRLSEVALRDGDLSKARALMKLAESQHMILPYQAALDYMKGEALRQEGKTGETEELWKKLASGKDDLYRAKAGLALTTLQLDKKEIKPEEAIDRLEGLRYAWRGDELETSVNYKLGQMYIAAKEPLKGLALLRQAVALSPASEQAKKINDEMAATFSGMFEPNKLKDLNPVDAISLYNEFSNLAPAGPAGDRLVRQLADRLVEADLLPRAAALLRTQVDSGKLQGVDGARTAIRLASIYALDSKPAKAIEALDKAVQMMGTNAATEPGLMREISILRAEALAQQNKPEEAFALLARLPQDGEVLRLRADIGWKAKRWQDAADSLEELVGQMQISPTRPASDEEASLLLNWAVALYLADNRYVLANLREKYTTAMAATSKAQPFEVVTRPRQSALLADRDTINSIIEETDIFKGFVESSRALNDAMSTTKQQAPAKTVAPVAPAKLPVTAPAETKTN